MLTSIRLAPEVLLTGFFNHATDVWSYGILCIEVLTRSTMLLLFNCFRKDPYPSIPLAEYASRAVKDQLPSTAANYIPKETPEVLRNIAYRCLSLDPSTRPAFSEIYQQLDALLSQ
jgi:serine/threonine protein kinase